jgi:hypothetical protein
VETFSEWLVNPPFRWMQGESLSAQPDQSPS